MKNTTKRILKSISTFALLFAAVLNGTAQKGEFGIRVMPTFSSFSAQSSSGGTIKGEVTLGYGFGALLGFNFTEHVGVQVEGIYTSISQKYVENDQEHKVHLKYINIPLLLSLNTGKLNPINLNAVLGPQLGLSAGSSIDSSGSGDGTTSTTAVVSVKRGDIGFAYGAGLDFGLNPLNTLRLSIGFRGVYGLLDISDNSRTIANDSYYILDKTNVKTYAGYLGFSILF